MKIKAFIGLKRAQALEDSINWLSYYINNTDKEHVVGENLENIDEEATEKLRQLSEVNAKRDELLNWFKTKSQE